MRTLLVLLLLASPAWAQKRESFSLFGPSESVDKKVEEAVQRALYSDRPDREGWSWNVTGRYWWRYAKALPLPAPAIPPAPPVVPEWSPTPVVVPQPRPIEWAPPPLQRWAPPVYLPRPQPIQPYIRPVQRSLG